MKSEPEMGDRCQKAVNHLTKEEMGNKARRFSTSNITATAT